VNASFDADTRVGDFIAWEAASFGGIVVGGASVDGF
jgi:hypothetical protein